MISYVSQSGNHGLNVSGKKNEWIEESLKRGYESALNALSILSIGKKINRWIFKLFYIKFELISEPIAQQLSLELVYPPQTGSQPG